MRVVVDRDRCEGNAVCVKIAPELFILDDDEYAIVTADPIPVEQQTLAEQAIAECPRAALSQRLGGTRSRCDEKGRVLLRRYPRRHQPTVLCCRNATKCGGIVDRRGQACESIRHHHGS